MVNLSFNYHESNEIAQNLYNEIKKDQSLGKLMNEEQALKPTLLHRSGIWIKPTEPSGKSAFYHI